jgi:hypothetical protein
MGRTLRAFVDPDDLISKIVCRHLEDTELMGRAVIGLSKVILSTRWQNGFRRPSGVEEQKTRIGRVTKDVGEWRCIICSRGETSPMLSEGTLDQLHGPPCFPWSRTPRTNITEFRKDGIAKF